jgi:uncharacterized protein (TIGR02757 family)
MLDTDDLKEFLEEKYNQYNRPEFIASDPISIPHLFSKKEDIEIAGFLAATIAWGQRVTIIKNANALINLMDASPYDFIMNANQKELKKVAMFKHRTFNGIDAAFFFKSLQNIYLNHGGLQNAFLLNNTKKTILLIDAITHFRNTFFSIPYPERTTKHVSSPADNSSAKRICMFLRWMVRNDKRGVDFGIWKTSPSLLMCPLDVHSGNVARKLGLLKRTQNDWKAVVELTESLKQFDHNDPVKYDFALFGLGVFEKF